MIKFFAKLFLEEYHFLYDKFQAWKQFGFFPGKCSVVTSASSMKIGKGFICGPFCQIYCQDPQNGSELVIGEKVALNSYVMINSDCGGKINIGNYVIMGPNVVIRAANHLFQQKNIPIQYQGHKAGTITIEDDVWLGGGVIVLPGVCIGKGSIIGAGSVVTKDIPPFSIAVGTPAKVIGQRGN